MDCDLKKLNCTDLQYNNIFYATPRTTHYKFKTIQYSNHVIYLKQSFIHSNRIE